MKAATNPRPHRAEPDSRRVSGGRAKPGCSDLPIGREPRHDVLMGFRRSSTRPPFFLNRHVLSDTFPEATCGTGERAILQHEANSPWVEPPGMISMVRVLSSFGLRAYVGSYGGNRVNFSTLDCPIGEPHFCETKPLTPSSRIGALEPFTCGWHTQCRSSLLECGSLYVFSPVRGGGV